MLFGDESFGYGLIFPSGELPTLKDTDPEIINRQVEEMLEKNGHKYFGVVHNLIEKSPQGLYRQIAISMGQYNQPMVTEGSPLWDAHSDRAQQTTAGEFYDDVDMAILDCPDIDPTELARLEIAYHSSNGDRPEAQENLAAYMLPIYVYMREMGYSHYDLSQ